MWYEKNTIISFEHNIVLMVSNSEILKIFGYKIRELRKEKGISQEELAEKAGLHRTYIGMIERAEKNVTLLNIEKIAKALSVSIKELFTDGTK